MTFKVDYVGEKTLVWRKDDGEAKHRVENYIPSFYIKSGNHGPPLEEIGDKAEKLDEVVRTRTEKWKTELGKNQTDEVLRIDVNSINQLDDAVFSLRTNLSLDDIQFFNVDIARQFRYCLDRNESPVPNEELKILRLQMPKNEIAQKDLSKLKIDGKSCETEEKILKHLQHSLRNKDPDILLVNTIQILPLVREKQDKYGFSFPLGRKKGFQTLAGESNFSSYGEIGHSPPRYNIIGRVIINQSNSFFWKQSGLEGMLDLVNRSWKPLQETAWGSIGNQLTSIQMRYALHKRKLLIPYRVYESEDFRSLETHKKSDRGGFTFSPKVGVFRDVYECDFASLYPNIMIEKRLSPETVRCTCHPDRNDVPEIGYSVCPDKNAFLSEVLEPIVSDRAEIKKKIKETSDKRQKEALQKKSDALKWILVSCFGYQGHAHAKFGSNKVHQSINAYDREIMIRAKEEFEKNNFRILHGIVDSIWAKTRDNTDKQQVLNICNDVSDEVGIELEFENHFDWIAFVPRKDSEAGTLTRYFGKKKSGGFKIRGIEARQDSTPKWIAEKQKELLHVLDDSISTPEPTQKLVEKIREQVRELKNNNVSPRKLLIEKQVRKDLENYQQYNRSASAIDRAKNLGVDIKKGQKARFVVANDNLENADKVRLEFEEINRYDTSFYTDLLIRASASITSPLGLRENKLRHKIQGIKASKLGNS